MRLVEHKKIKASKFDKYSLLLDSDKEWRRPGDLYAGDECTDASVAPYYRSLKQLISCTETPDKQLRYKIDVRYWDIPGFSKFCQAHRCCL